MLVNHGGKTPVDISQFIGDGATFFSSGSPFMSELGTTHNISYHCFICGEGSMKKDYRCKCQRAPGEEREPQPNPMAELGRKMAERREKAIIDAIANREGR